MEIETLKDYIRKIMDGLVFELKQTNASMSRCKFKLDEAERSLDSAIREMCDASYCADKWAEAHDLVCKIRREAQENPDG